MTKKIRGPDEIQRVAVEGGEVVTYSFGSGNDVIFLLHGGPSLRSDHLQHTHAFLADYGYRVVTFDQLGTGKSDKPDNPALWTIERIAKEADTVRQKLNLGKVHLYGQSFGAMLAMEVALTFPDSLKSLVIAHGCASGQGRQREVDRLIADLGPEFVRMRRRHEFNGTMDHPEYQASETLLWHRHVVRMEEWPAELVEAAPLMNQQVVEALFGTVSHITGNLKNWNRLPDLNKINVPTLIFTGEHDWQTPELSFEMYREIPNAHLHIFRNVAHMSMYECPDEYRALLTNFWDKCCDKK